MKLKATDHRYYSSGSNYYVNGYNNFGRCDYDTWEDFKDDWLDNDGNIDDDYNHVFRFDIIQNRDEEADELIEGYQLWLFFILQRKGIYRPVWIKNIEEKDMEEIKSFLENRWEYLKEQWVELSGGGKHDK